MNSIKAYNILLKIANAEIAVKCVLVMNNILGAFLFDYTVNSMEMNQVRIMAKNIETLNLFKCIYMDKGLLITKKGTKLNFDICNYKDKSLNKFLVYYPNIEIQEEDKYNKYIISIMVLISEPVEEIRICEIIRENKNDDILFNKIKNCLKGLTDVTVNKHIAKVYDFNQEIIVTVCALFSKGMIDCIMDEIKMAIKKMIELSDYEFLLYLHDNNNIDMFDIKIISFIILIITMIESDDLYDIEDVNIKKITKMRQTYFIKKYMETAYEKKLDKEEQRYLELKKIK